jgi:predicted aspartyl protease
VVVYWNAPAVGVSAVAITGKRSSLTAAERMDALPFDYALPQVPLIVTEGRIGERDERVAVVVDTGASAPFALFIGEAVAKRLKLKLSAPVTPPSSTAVGPQQQTYRTGTVARFSLGPVQLAPVDVAVVPMIDGMQKQVGRRIDAIVGHRFFEGRTVSIDYARQKLDLAATAGAADAAVPFRYASAKPLMLVPVTVNGTGPYVFEIDTGATASSLSPAVARLAAVDIQAQGSMGGAGGAIAVQVGSATLAFAGISRPLNPIAVSDAVKTIGAAAGADIDGILGTDFFRGTTLTIDFPQQNLWLDAPASN